MVNRRHPPWLELQCQSCVLAVSVPEKIVESGIELTPSIVVNWLYQATVEIHFDLLQMLGDERFNEKGQMCAQALPGSTGSACLGEVSLMWGSDVGARRDQGMLAHDVDVDLAVFLKDGVHWAPIWKSLSTSLTHKGYRCTAGPDGIHFRVGPNEPIELHEWKELRNEIKAKCLGLSRTQINRKASPKYRQGLLQHSHMGSLISI